MSRLNRGVTPIHTHEGAKALHINPELQLRRTVMSCMLWEKEFYIDGQSAPERIETLVPKVDPDKVAGIAVEAREDMKLRHVPLLIVAVMAGLPNHKKFVAQTLAQVIQRPDELTEFLAIYWRKGKCSLSAQVKKGLAKAFTKFNAYNLAKYDRDSEIKLRDVLFLCHAKPKDAEQATTWSKLIDGTLEAPDTWEVALSSGGDKREHWERLLKEEKLGALAMLRNLRNMQDVGVEKDLIRKGLLKLDATRVLPFRFIAASRYALQFEKELEVGLFASCEGISQMEGKTGVLVDVSGSMCATLSGKSDMSRQEAAYGVAMVARQICKDVRVFTFSEALVEVAPRHGFALRDAMESSQRHWSTYLGDSVKRLNQMDFDRLIVITDEQSHDRVPDPAQEDAYMINVASYKNGVGYGKWTHIDGFSEAVIKFIIELENWK